MLLYQYLAELQEFMLMELELDMSQILRHQLQQLTNFKLDSIQLLLTMLSSMDTFLIYEL